MTVIPWKFGVLYHRDFKNGKNPCIFAGILFKLNFTSNATFSDDFHASARAASTSSSASANVPTIAATASSASSNMPTRMHATICCFSADATNGPSTIFASPTASASAIFTAVSSTAADSASGILSVHLSTGKIIWGLNLLGGNGNSKVGDRILWQFSPSCKKESILENRKYIIVWVSNVVKHTI
jgi:hypothetical protein